ncbi:HDOD domain-containing protein [Leptospira sp. 2 VSF19]|uniref:HDOD domain-containing protein n=1 Tax=Leptospira soteropolitanensis TaxID=2950025 RepID=A0AAW5VMQ2_9LEPT|nr:HDOD domain-containing protein [Leptospira soteropolitanensis]MCW7492403.1 HDOD domain-containing protein [Leptospira soteropolitanensis]MCW7500455.1 HDOD domain-containing protein [Leptospira soteropolitanensis]MCW7522875.1 HDOD domain-containing protein [Leptospira soteropolitanensis]MCW7526734.1 HDOD domain-containing protein [Leptospira soteropolitanensis]MCW7530425.1 HDOD domain-containing protein [Leptospira soteropolitanensis]
MLKSKVDEVLQDVNKLPAISSVVSKVLEKLQKPDVNIADLAQEISKDPAITANVIKLSNSAYYRASKPIRTVQEALMTLGIKTVKEIVLLTAAKGILSQDLNSYQLEAAQLWTSSLLVAELSSKIVQHKKLKIDKDLAFTSGLLCSVGKIVLAQFFSPVMMQIKTDLKDNQEPFPNLEKKYFGYTHMEVSENLLKRWNFPQELTDVVANYLTPENSKSNPILTSVVHIASILIVVSGIGIDIGGESVPISPFALSQTGVTEADIETYFVHIPDLQAGLADLLNV